MISWILRWFIRPHKRRVVRVQEPRTGVVHDLAAIYEAVNQHYFSGKIQIKIGWSQGKAGRVTRSRRLGSYCFQTEQIRIHRLLDQAHFPSQFIAFVVYHEILHSLFPPKRAGSRRRKIHHPEFVAQERKFEGYNELKVWEKENRHLFFRPLA